MKRRLKRIFDKPVSNSLIRAGTWASILTGLVSLIISVFTFRLTVSESRDHSQLEKLNEVTIKLDKEISAISSLDSSIVQENKDIHKEVLDQDTFLQLTKMDTTTKMYLSRTELRAVLERTFRRLGDLYVFIKDPYRVPEDPMGPESRRPLNIKAGAIMDTIILLKHNKIIYSNSSYLRSCNGLFKSLQSCKMSIIDKIISQRPRYCSFIGDHRKAFKSFVMQFKLFFSDDENALFNSLLEDDYPCK